MPIYDDHMVQKGVNVLWNRVELRSSELELNCKNGIDVSPVYGRYVWKVIPESQPQPENAESGSRNFPIYKLLFSALVIFQHVS